MAKIVIFALVAMMAVAALAAPADDVEVEQLEESVRLPRATCDLASAFGAADSLCAAHCIAKRFKGGWCEKGVCHCRH